MQQLKLAGQDDALDATLIRMPKVCPGYFGAAYEQFDEIKDCLDGMPNLYLVGRNGMHRYSNQDHSILSARLAGSVNHEAIWAVNVDDEYREEQSQAPAKTADLAIS